MTRTETLGSSARRAATTEPEVPPLATISELVYDIWECIGDKPANNVIVYVGFWVSVVIRHFIRYLYGSPFQNLLTIQWYDWETSKYYKYEWCWRLFKSFYKIPPICRVPEEGNTSHSGVCGIMQSYSSGTPRVSLRRKILVFDVPEKVIRQTSKSSVGSWHAGLSVERTATYQEGTVNDCRAPSQA